MNADAALAKRSAMLSSMPLRASMSELEQRERRICIGNAEPEGAR